MKATAARSDLAGGQIVAGRYQLLSLCGKGGMGSVWRARHLPDSRECAVKILHHTVPERVPHLAGRFVREAKVASAIDSPHAVRVLDYGLDGGLPFIVMELLEGETLAARLRRSGRLTAVETFDIVDQVAKALTHAHAIGVVHRDLKPANVFLSRSSDGTVVAKVLDFGIAKIIDEETISRDLTETGALLGTPHYMSPEQIDGARYVDHRADLWSLAVIAFECMTGQRPFLGEGLRALFLAICVHERPLASSLCPVPPEFDAWFAACTNTDPTKRHRTAAELAEELGKVCRGSTVVSERPPAQVGTSTTDDAPATDSLTGSARGGFDAPARRYRPRKFQVWGFLALLLVASGSWLLVRGARPMPVLISSSITAPSVSVPVAEPNRTLSAPDSSGAKLETRDPPPARAPRFRPSFVPKPAPTPEAPQPAEPARSVEPVPPVQPVPSAKPEVWDYGEMLKDRN